MVDVGCKFALNEMRRYGAFQSEVNSFPTINRIPPRTVPLSLFSHSNPFHSPSIIFSFSSRLFLFLSRSPHRILLTYIVLDIYPTSIYVYTYMYMYTRLYVLKVAK